MSFEADDDQHTVLMNMAKRLVLTQGWSYAKCRDQHAIFSVPEGPPLRTRLEAAFGSEPASDLLVACPGLNDTDRRDSVAEGIWLVVSHHEEFNASDFDDEHGGEDEDENEQEEEYKRGDSSGHGAGRYVRGILCKKT